jgi:peptide/nickel transport system substrate-binding protein
VEPWLATSRKYTDAKTLVMRLRDGVTFTDGAAVDASAVKANIMHGKEVKPQSSKAAPVVNGISSVDVVNRLTVRLNLKSANPDIPIGPATGGGYMVSPRALEHPDALVLGIVGTGVYALDKKSTVAQQRYAYTRNHL